MIHAPTTPVKSATALGVLCGVGSALFWALGFVAARHGVLIGMSPLALALHRFVWPGLALLPVIAVGGLGNLGGVGWRRGIVLTLFGGLPLALLSYIGYLFVPLGHGGIIQPSCAALGGLVLARLVLKEPLPRRRVAGALAIVIGLGVIGIEALRTLGSQGLAGDLLFVAAGSSFAVFGMFLRRWRISPMRAVAVTSVLVARRSARVAAFWVRRTFDGGLFGKPVAGRRARRVCRCWRHLSLYACRGPTWCKPCGVVSVACPALHITDRIPCARRGAEHLATHRASDCHRRLPADAEDVMLGTDQKAKLLTPPCGWSKTRPRGQAL